MTWPAGSAPPRRLPRLCGHRASASRSERAREARFPHLCWKPEDTPVDPAGRPFDACPEWWISSAPGRLMAKCQSGHGLRRLVSALVSSMLVRRRAPAALAPATKWPPSWSASRSTTARAIGKLVGELEGSPDLCEVHGCARFWWSEGSSSGQRQPFIVRCLRQFYLLACR